MRIWTLKGFVTESGRDEVLDWYRALPANARAKFKSIMQRLVDQPHEFWSPPVVKPLTGFAGIYEIRFRSKDVVYRPLGFFGPEQNEFTFLKPATERDDDFDPKNAPQIALERKNIIMSDEERARVYRV
jgi:hypothetical protein